ncbi:MAG: hypothetical protein ACLFQJ_07250 [Campylobacterales bacterium]
MSNLIIATVITVITIALIYRFRKKDERHKKNEYLIDNISFKHFKNGK